MNNHKGFSFPLDVDISTGRIKTVSDDDAVRQSIGIILKTEHGERLMRSSFGTQLNKFMFGNIDLPFITSMNESLVNALELWEDNIDSLQVDVQPVFEEESLVEVSISYKTNFSPDRQGILIEKNLTL